MKEQARKKARVWSKANVKAKANVNVNVDAKKINLRRSEVEKTMTGELLTSLFLFSVTRRFRSDSGY